MKAVIIVLMAFISIEANGQWKRLKKEKGMADFKPKIDTFYFNDEMIPIERYNNSDLASAYHLGGVEYQIAMGLNNTQEQFDKMKQYVIQHREINFIKFGEKTLSDVKKADGNFDLSNYQTELEFYKRYQYPDKVTYTSSSKKSYAKTLNSISAIILKIDSSKQSVSQFNDILVSSVPEYSIVLIDTISDKNVINYTYKNKEGEFLNFIYELQTVGYNPDLKQKGIILVRKQSITGQFFSILKVYNKLFSLDIQSDEAQKHGNYSGVMVYDGTMYNFFFNRSNKSGYWEISVQKY